MTLVRQGVPLVAVPPRAVWIDSFARWADMGVLEQAGPGRDHPLIVEMLRLAGLPNQHDETPWCASAVNASMIESGMHGPSRPAAARSWEAWGARLAEPRFGCVAVLWRDSPISGHGHVACWLGDAPGGNMLLLGGNQRNRVAISQYPTSRLLSFRWPDHTCLLELDNA